MSDDLPLVVLEGHACIADQIVITQEAVLRIVLDDTVRYLEQLTFADHPFAGGAGDVIGARLHPLIAKPVGARAKLAGHCVVIGDQRAVGFQYSG